MCARVSVRVCVCVGVTRCVCAYVYTEQSTDTVYSECIHNYASVHVHVMHTKTFETDAAQETQTAC